MSHPTKSPSPLADLPPLLSIDQTADLLHLTRRSVARMLSQGRLAGTKITRSGTGPGGRRLVLRASIEQLVAAGMDDR